MLAVVVVLAELIVLGVAMTYNRSLALARDTDVAAQRVAPTKRRAASTFVWLGIACGALLRMLLLVDSATSVTRSAATRNEHALVAFALAVVIPLCATVVYVRGADAWANRGERRSTGVARLGDAYRALGTATAALYGAAGVAYPFFVWAIARRVGA